MFPDLHTALATERINDLHRRAQRDHGAREARLTRRAARRGEAPTNETQQPTVPGQPRTLR